jgi:hypothetical protein
MFITNDKGTSWAYATPGFSNSLDPDLLKQLRSLAHVPESAKLITEVRAPRISIVSSIPHINHHQQQKQQQTRY